MTRKLVLATTNPGKIKELRELLTDHAIDVVSISDATAEPFEVVEDGDTFAANAIKKATAAADLTGWLALADDSGLEVDALEGAPRVRSARFAHEHATDSENISALIAALHAKNVTTSPARFRCAIALVDPDAPDGPDGPDGTAPLVFEGVCEGTVMLEPRGMNGFGYDPLFIVDGFDRTMAELTPAEKNSVSHRARALAQIRAYFPKKSK